MTVAESPTSGVPAPTPIGTPVDAPHKPKIIKCPYCDSTVFRNGEPKKRSEKFAGLEKLESENESLRAQVQQLRDQLRERSVDPPPAPAPTPSPAPAPKRKSFLVGSPD